MQNEVQNLELIEEENITEESVLNYLVAIGVNACRRCYDSEQKAMYESYINLPLSVIVDCWDHLDQNVKLNVVESNLESFKKWAKESSDD